MQKLYSASFIFIVHDVHHRLRASSLSTHPRVNQNSTDIWMTVTHTLTEPPHFHLSLPPRLWKLKEPSLNSIKCPSHFPDWLMVYCQVVVDQQLYTGSIHYPLFFLQWICFVLEGNNSLTRPRHQSAVSEENNEVFREIWWTFSFFFFFPPISLSEKIVPLTSAVWEMTGTEQLGISLKPQCSSDWGE